MIKITTKVIALSAIAFLGFNANAQQKSQNKAKYTPTENIVPKKNNQVAGYYRMKLGDYEITALYDGYLSIGTPSYQEFTKLTKTQLDDLNSSFFRPILPDGGVQSAVIGFLINTGKNLVLLDAGSGDVLEGVGKDQYNKVGKLVRSLMASGYTPEQVDVILPTHLHFDHFSGVTQNGKKVFPNATLYISNQENNFWVKTPTEKISETQQIYAKWAKEAIEPYAKEDRVRYYNLGDEVIPNFKSVATVGHSPGHGGFEVNSKGETIFVWGDLLHNHALQLSNPSIAAEFDVDSKNARDSRVKMLPQLAKRKIWVAGAHLPFPGIGHIVKEKEGFSWVPIEYVPLEY